MRQLLGKTIFSGIILGILGVLVLAGVGWLELKDGKIKLAEAQAGANDYSLDFSSYIGGKENLDMVRDITADSQGYIYITGGTQSASFPTTPGAYDRTFDTTGTQIGSAGYCDIFVAKINPSTGQIVWSTLVGGPNYDRAYAIELDSQGYIYIAGRAGPGFPTTSGSFQPSFQGSSQDIYGKQNGFVAKLSPDGSQLIWASYVGTGWLCRDMALDNNGDVYLPLTYSGSGPVPPSAWFQNVYQKSPKGGSEFGAIKIKGDGSQALWASWLGGSADDSTAVSIRVDNNGYVYIGASTYSADIPTTVGAHDRSYYNDGATDFYVAKLSPDGSNLVYGTYLGGKGDQWISAHNLAIDNSGNAYVAVPTGPDFPVTVGAFQSAHGGGTVDWGVAKISPTGALIAASFIGGNGGENPDGIYVDSSGNVFISGQTTSTNFPVTANAYQSSNRGSDDAVFVVLSADFSQLLYSTYLGGSSADAGRNSFLGSDGSWYLAGTSNGNGWPVVNGF